MRIVRSRADARWFPSRHNTALFRLLAYVQLRRAKPRHSDSILIIDRHQSATETWAVMSWVTLTLACYLAATLFAEWHAAIAVPISVPLAIALLEVPAILSSVTIAPLWRWITGATDGIRINSFVVMTLFAAASAYFARHASWVRFVAWQFLALLAINAVAALIVVALRGSIERLEATFGGATFAD